MSYSDEIKKLKESDKKFVWHPFTQMKDWFEEDPIIITEGRDCFVKDAYGKWYLDGVSSIWVNIHGHRKKEIDDAIKTQLDKIAHSTLLGLGNIPSIELAEKLINLTDKSFAGLTPRLSKVFYSDNGSTAVEAALKMAFQYWIHKGVKGKQTFLSLKNAYHGDTIGAVSVGGIDIFHDMFSPLLFKAYKAPSPHCYRCELGKTSLECSFTCLKEMENILEKHSDEIAAVIIEPIVQAAGGMIVWPEGYLKDLRELCNRYNVLLIADEVATGFGRTGKMFACEHENIVPDIMCLSKGITNGYMPLAVTLATDEIFNAFLGEFKELKTFFHGHSYTGNPLACAAAIASIDLFDKEETLKNMRPKIALLEDRLKEIADLPIVGNVRNKGLIAGIELVKDKPSKEPFPWEKKMGWNVAYKAREGGVLIRPLGNVIVVMPPLSISIENLKRLMDVIKKAIIVVSSS
ncbi:MAG: adenosylmethionine--8-amino-7-oxononanoate transaminase [Nitrospirae bacterium GWB2_47_37]|nr:MAG: adenosylmethionine--8-amino-7-oxononanoate transaminase [Nitrospirae bacterium GWA2_46_11]OGW24852.1 MAG: adenosylmethionine--8-amino-7-oxononanoate transaminase [Nitrospirae bacterium GWB2_47_37]HAK88179.1 adenosylmethionine--8-amino-7-oxononanoate transaminase [Nitrospiraceae bacterium]